jgi:hypothetical protein
VGRRAKVVLSLAVAAAVMVAAALLFASGSDDAVTVGVEGGAVTGSGVEVEIPAHAVRGSADVAIEEVDYNAVNQFPDFTALSRTFSIDVDQRLARPASVSIPVLDEPRAGTTILVASRETPVQMWILSPGRYEARDQAVSFRTSEFTEFQILETVKNAVVDAGVAATKTFLKFGGVRRDEPDCGEPAVGWGLQGDTGTGDANAVLYACLETEGSEAAVHIVSNRAIGLSMSLPAGFRTIDVSNPNIPDQVARALRSAAGSRIQDLPAAGEIRVAGPVGRAQFEIRPTFGSLAFDLALFAVGEFGGKGGRSVKGAVDFLRCVNGIVDSSDKANRELGGLQAGLDFAYGAWRDCGDALARSGAGAAAEAGAVFFGGIKFGTASADALGSLVNREHLELRIRPAPVGPGTACGVVKSGRSWNPYGDYSRPLDVEVEVSRGMVLCSEAMATLSWYLRLDPESACADAGSLCVQDHRSWICYTPPPPSFPTLTQCKSGSNEVRGIDTEPLPTKGSIQACGDGSPSGPVGPYNVETNLQSCNQAKGVADSTLYGLGGDLFSFACKTRLTGIESDHRVCRSGNAVVIYDSGA